MGARLIAMRSVPLRLYGLALLAALLQLLPFPLAGPVPLWRRLFCWICLVPLLYALLGRNRKGEPLRPAQGALVGYVCGIAWFAGNCYWIYQTMFLYGGLPGPVSAGILILFSLYLGLYFALFGACFAAIRRWKSAEAAVLCTPFLWVAVELARARITGFPWDLLGYAQVDDLFLTHLERWTGVMGISLLVAAVNVLWVLWLSWARAGRSSARWAAPLLATAIMAASYAGSVRSGSIEHPAETAILLQENLSVGAEARGPRESEPELLQNFAQLSFHPVLTSAAGRLAVPQGAGGLPRADILLWPEAPTSFIDADPAFRESMGAVARTLHAPVVVDSLGRSAEPDGAGRYDEFVSASFFLPDGSYDGRYDKMHLVPFGEYTPYKQLFFFAGHLLDGLNFVPGRKRRLFSVEGHRYGVFICYESIFGDEIREFAVRGAQVLVNLSDDGWYGDTSAPWEHLDMARMRAIENDRWLLRDTNTGLTASIDPEGRLVAQMPRHIRGAVEVPFAFRDDLTFYTRHGDWIAWLSAIIAASVLAGSGLQRRYPAAPNANKVN